MTSHATGARHVTTLVTDPHKIMHTGIFVLCNAQYIERAFYMRGHQGGRLSDGAKLPRVRPYGSARVCCTSFYRCVSLIVF